MSLVRHRAFTAILTLALFAVPSPSQAYVDLRPEQTRIKFQGNRNTCITFAAIAALEAAYKRAGWPDLDLSEEFCSYMGKMFWLHYDWSAITDADKRENQLAAWGGGGGTWVARYLTMGMATPADVWMPYREEEYDLGTRPDEWDDPFWRSQKNVNDFNLDPVNLLPQALRAPSYYSGEAFQLLSDATDPAGIEAVLRAGYEVVWDFRGVKTTARIWRASSAVPDIAHAMLIVGYDRTSPDPNEHHFIVKNSWGETSIPGADGFTYIGYDYIRYGIAAGYFTGVNPPRPWPELRFIGRRNISFDGHRGTLDIYHLPGMADPIFAEYGIPTVDRRLGTFYDSTGTAHRVNGSISGNTVTFWFKSSNPNMEWSELREAPTLGRMFRYTIVDYYGEELAGWHHDNPGATPSPPWGGYARKASTVYMADGFLQPDFNNGQAWAPEQYLGIWRTRFRDLDGELVFARRDDSLVPASRRSIHAGLVTCYRTPDGTEVEFVAEVNRADPGYIYLDFVHPTAGAVWLRGRMLSHERGVFAGPAEVGPSFDEGFYAVRLGDHSFGSTESFGEPCGGKVQAPRHSVSGIPEPGQYLRFQVGSPVPNSPVLLVLGLSRKAFGEIPLPYSLAVFGAPDCFVYVAPHASAMTMTDAQGFAEIELKFQGAALVGKSLYSQGFPLVPGANAMGVTATNAIHTTLGGTH